MPTVPHLTENEQLFLELVNRARLDPAAEAARHDIGLNDPDPDGPADKVPSPALTADPKQPLAPDPLLSLAAGRHSDDMLARDYFAHQAPEVAPFGSTPKARMENAGYDLTGAWATGENLAWVGTTGTLDLDAAILAHHAGLFKSVGHRENILQDIFRETGIAQVEGVFTPQSGADAGTDFNASMLTHKFATSGPDIFLTGVAYSDLDGDGFYSLGESEASITLSVAGNTAQTAPAGGYAMALAAGTTLVEVTYAWGGVTRSATVDMDGRNAKIDLVGGTRLLSSGDLTLGDGVTEGGLLGAGSLVLTGNELDNLLIAGGGNNIIYGAGGQDVAGFSGALADYTIVRGGEAIIVTDTRTADDLNQGINSLTGVESLRFSDGDFGIDEILDPVPLLPGDGPLALSGHLRDPSGADLAGASVRFTPEGASGPAFGDATGSGGRFELGLAEGATGHLDADLAYPAGGGDITAGDALEVLRIAVGLAPSFGPVQPRTLVAADLTGDGRVTAGDALEVLRHAVGLDSPHAPKWVFFDAGLDWTAQDLDTDSVTVPRGLDIAALDSDLDISMTGILLGNMDAV
ncbi:CAP domain-containing protein [Roseovarius sp. D22-M7]|uniref:CAP domain-containing protein n=1 Tax=Roseovarius sp. D22-M7 TaxID=3127116 RepID=UPI0030101E7C